MQALGFAVLMAGLSISGAKATTYYATFEMPLTDDPGPAIPGATHIKVTFQNATPFVRGGCTTTAILWNFNDGANTPQTLVFNSNFTSFALSSAVSGPASLCRDVYGNVTKLDAYFLYSSVPLGQNYYEARFYYPAQNQEYCFIDIERYGETEYSNFCATAPVWSFSRR